MSRQWNIFAFTSLADVAAMSQHCSCDKTFSSHGRDIGILMSRHWHSDVATLAIFLNNVDFYSLYAESFFFSLISCKT